MILIGIMKYQYVMGYLNNTLLYFFILNNNIL